MKNKDYLPHADWDQDKPLHEDAELKGIEFITLFSLFFGLSSGIFIGIMITKFHLFGL